MKITMEERERANAKEILEEVALAINDTFIARCERVEGGIIMRLLNGQKFRLNVEEEI